MKLIDKDALVAEIKRQLDCCYKICAGNLDFLQKSYPEHYYSIETYKEILSFLDTLEVKEVDLDAYTKISKALSVAFMQFLDNIRPEGKMCLSNAECFDIEKAFAMMDYSKLLRYMEKYSMIKTQKGE